MTSNSISTSTSKLTSTSSSTNTFTSTSTSTDNLELVFRIDFEFFNDMRLNGTYEEVNWGVNDLNFCENLCLNRSLCLGYSYYLTDSKQMPNKCYVFSRINKRINSKSWMAYIRV